MINLWNYFYFAFELWFLFCAGQGPQRTVKASESKIYNTLGFFLEVANWSRNYISEQMNHLAFKSVSVFKTDSKWLLALRHYHHH